MSNITSLFHPSYLNCKSRWLIYESIWKGGDAFKDSYLIKYSNRETPSDYALRKKITYIPGHAKTAVLEVKNSIYERFIDIGRNGGTPKYTNWVKSNVDGNGATMNQFIGTQCLKELLIKARVGVYVDAPAVDSTITKKDEDKHLPYVYMYKAEDIRSWYRENNELVAVLLTDYEHSVDKDFKLVTSYKTKYRYLLKTDNGVEVRMYDNKGKEIESEFRFLDIPNIPFEFIEIDHSILESVAEHQIALLNMASSDLHYCLKANFPFYTEQRDPRASLDGLTGGDDFSENAEGSSANANENSSQNLLVGPVNGRTYSMGTERPQFIHPSAEPLNASMKKQEEIRTEIRQLVMLSVSSLSPDAPENSRDDQGLEAGLAYIGLQLEYLERKIAYFFAMYENKDGEVATINYPIDYKIRSEEERQKEASKLLEISPKIPSLTYRKESSKRVADLTLGHWVTNETLATIKKEIDSAEVIDVAPEILIQDLQAGIVSEKTASLARLYPKGEVEQARVDHAERLNRILVSQTSVKDAAARGIKDADTEDGDSAIKEKNISQSPDMSDDKEKKVRGES